jgi:hypothetical protein
MTEERHLPNAPERKHQYVLPKKGMMIADRGIDQPTYEYINIFMVSGSIHVIKNWVENGMDKRPGEMAGFCITLSIGGSAGHTKFKRIHRFG